MPPVAKGRGERLGTVKFCGRDCEAPFCRLYPVYWHPLPSPEALLGRRSGALTWHDAQLIPRHGLQAPNVIGKQVADWRDLLVLLTFNIAYDTAIFPRERHRLNLAGCYLFLIKKKPKDGSWEEIYAPKSICPRDRDMVMRRGPAPFDTGYVVGVRKDGAQDEFSDEIVEAMLAGETLGRGRPKALCYEDILLMVVRHPVTGDDVLAMAVKFIHHKGADNNPKPTIFYFTPARRLIFCLVTIIVSIAVHDRAFDATNLISVASVFRVKNSGPRPVFRRFNGSEMSMEEAMLYSRLRDDMARQSLDAGQEKPTQPKGFRRGAANEADGNAPDAVRDQMLRHDPKWATFNSVYINPRVRFHLQNAVLYEPYEDALIEMLTHISVMRDPRASRDIAPDEVWRKMPPDPEIVELEQRRERLKGGQYRIRGQDNEQEIRDLTELIRRKKAQRVRKIIKEYRDDYFYHRPTWDIERQAHREEEEEEEEYVEPAINLQIPERAQLAEILCKQAQDLSPEQFHELRIQAAELMVSLCDKRETKKRDAVRRRPSIEVIVKEESSSLDQFPLLMERTLSYEERIFKYCRPAVMYDHFDREHATQLKEQITSRENILEGVLSFFKNGFNRGGGSESEYFQAEEILDSPRRRRRMGYLVKWEEYGHEHDNWKSVAHLEKCPEILQQFRKRMGRSE
ncbi:hypothetical protein C7999DRAFT_39654 [Corynascus novoguineensis]|uniref:Chromo domain-containing protein n=1 Tax=Corynascus novoguineensis TaxID=1126955 RepID=A0AAN7CY19_9PEZI|nr:hypothetical protein C7999DRAFT_39654 [Corynascus novoguineensis]